MRTIRRSTRRLIATLLIRLGKPHYALAVRGWAPIAGAEDPPVTDPPTDPPKTDPPKTDPPPTNPPPSDPSKPPPSQADLDKAYEKLRAAERDRDEAARKLKEREDAEKSELDLAKERVAELEGTVTAATEKLRSANVLTGLAAHEKIGPAKAKAAAKLIEDVEYADDGEPTNLDARIDALLTEHAALFAPPATGSSDAGKGPDGKLTLSEIKQLARENPKRFNEMFDKGEIPASALGA